MAACGQGVAGRRRAGGAFPEAGAASQLVGEPVGTQEGTLLRQGSSGGTLDTDTLCCRQILRSPFDLQRKVRVDVCVATRLQG